MAIGESTFDIIYLLFAYIGGILIISRARGDVQFKLAGWAILILAFGDSFHLVPRIIALNLSGTSDPQFMLWLGLGSLIASVTMTVFYVLMYLFWSKHYSAQAPKRYFDIITRIAVIRLGLLAFPQNNFFSTEPALLWAIGRNIPFALLGFIVLYFFYQTRKLDPTLKFMWLAITLSFAFYIPVVIFVDFIPLMGMLMIPKTLCYMWIIAMIFTAQSKSASPLQTKHASPSQSKSASPSQSKSASPTQSVKLKK